MKELVFLGHKVSHRGVEPDTQKIVPIIDIPNPTNKKELQRFSGMINYLGKFIPNLSNEAAPPSASCQGCYVVFRPTSN